MNKAAFISLCLYIISMSSYAQNANPYTEIITAEAVTEKGFMSTHLLKNRLYLEIPSTVLNKDMLFVNHNFPFSYKQIKWVKRNNRIHLIIPEIESEIGNTIQLVKDRFIEEITPITFPILTMGINELSYVIDVTGLFLSPAKELPGSGKTIFDDLAFINKVLTFEDTIEVKTNKTIASDVGPISIDADFSLFLLPEPMMPRLYDHRMGFPASSDPLSYDPVRATIRKWRLEKIDETRNLSEPVKPIILYFDPATPDKWKPYIKAGVEEWLPAFEAAGFKDAIEVKEPPLDDLDWSLNSMRYSGIRWSNKSSKYRGYKSRGVGAAYNTIDQRSGEILKSDIILGSIDVLMEQYFVRCSPLDTRAHQYPLPDDLIGEILQYITAHEAGHVFGLRDSNYGKYTYPFEKMRDKKWLQQMGHTPSVMNYTRQNFIVQPEDGIPPSLLQQKVGPTDFYSIRWAYTPFREAKTPDEELPYLEKIVREQDSVPWYRFNAANEYNTGPGAMNEVVESDNPMEATALGIENLKRVIELIPIATRRERGSKIKENLHRKTLDLWVQEMRMVASLVGGYTIHYKSGSQIGTVYKPISKSVQREAVSFLNKHAFQAPSWLVPTSLMRQYWPKFGDSQNSINSSLDMITERQLKILYILLADENIKKLEETSLTAKNAYTVELFFQDLNNGLWNELESKSILINPYRQQLQLGHIEKLKAIVTRENVRTRFFSYSSKGKYSNSNYVRSAALNALKSLKAKIQKRIRKTIDPVTKAHLELCLLELCLEDLNKV